MAFNMLDDDIIPIDDGYTPTIGPSSRTGSMKKFTKKEDRPSTAVPSLQKPSALKPTSKDNLDDFDDLLDQLMDINQKTNQKRPQTSNLSKQPQSRNVSAFDDLKFSDESAFGPKESITFNNQKTLPKPLELSKQSKFNDTNTFKLSDDNSSFNHRRGSTLVNDDSDAVPFKSRRDSVLRKEASPKNVIVEEDAPSMTIGSSRMMRPPMGRKSSMNLNAPEVENKPTPMFSLIDQSNNLTQTAEPGRLGRRASGSSNQSPLPEPSPYTKEQPKRHSFLTDQQQKPSRQFSYQQKPAQRIVQRVIQKVIQAPKVDTSAIRAQHQRQMLLLKESYQRQIKTITDSLQRQVKEEKQAKNKVMEDSRDLVRREKENHDKILKEELQRTKKMSDWEKEKIETTFKSQIQRLKYIVSSQQKSIPEPSVSYLQKRRIQDLEHKLKYQLESVQADKRKVSKLEADLEQRQEEFKKFKSNEQKRLRDEFNKVVEKDQKNNKKISEAMGEVNAQKQRLAIEMAQLQHDLARQRQELNGRQNLLRLNQDNFQYSKQEAQRLNQQMYNSYKVKLQDVQESKKNAFSLENDLLNKLKIVQLKGKEVYKGDTQTNLFNNPLVYPNRTLQNIPPRGFSADKKRPVQDNSIRLRKVQDYVKHHGATSMNKTFMSQTNTSGFGLDKFIRDIDGYKKERRMLH